MGGWSDKTKLKLDSTQVEVVDEVEVGVELDNNWNISIIFKDVDVYNSFNQDSFEQIAIIACMVDFNKAFN